MDRVPRPEFVLGEPIAHGSPFRLLYGPEDDDGRRQVVAHIDQSSPHFDTVLDRVRYLTRKD